VNPPGEIGLVKSALEKDDLSRRQVDKENPASILLK
jgi:hypothetical protein